MKTESVFASKVAVGERYTTKAGFAVTVVAVGQTTWGKPSILVTLDENGSRVSLAHDQLLWPRGNTDSKEAITMAKKTATKAVKVPKAKAVKAEKVAAAPVTAVETVGPAEFILVRQYNGKEHRVKVGGGAFLYERNSFESLRSIARVIRGDEYEYDGFGFFGIRTPETKVVLDLVRSYLKAKRDAKAAEAKAAAPAPEAKPAKAPKKAAKRASRAKKVAPVVSDGEGTDVAPEDVLDPLADDADGGVDAGGQDD